MNERGSYQLTIIQLDGFLYDFSEPYKAPRDSLNLALKAMILTMKAALENKFRTSFDQQYR